MTYKTVLTEVRGRVGIVRLNRPEARNAFNQLLLREMFEALEAFDRDDEIRVLVLTGDEKAFAAGADIKEMAEASPFEMIQSRRVEVFDRMRLIRKPVIAAVS
ncbi:MAG: enoyl-CoA hydratase-related protein, partial [Lentisphaerota bacterium]